MGKSTYSVNQYRHKKFDMTDTICSMYCKKNSIKSIVFISILRRKESVISVKAGTHAKSFFLEDFFESLSILLLQRCLKNYFLSTEGVIS